MKQVPTYLETDCSPIRVVIADDHPIFIDGFKALIRKLNVHGVEYAGEALNGKALIELVEVQKPDIVFTDIQMPLLDGIAATRIIKSKHPDAKVIALSGFNETSLILDMIEAGASGYMLKNTCKQEVYESILALQDGKSCYCPACSEKLSEYSKRQKHPEKKDELSASEKQIIVLICKGFSNKEIASQLRLSKRTIENYRGKIMEKIEVDNTVELAMFAVRNAIYTP